MPAQGVMSGGIGSAGSERQSHNNMKARLCKVVGCCVDLTALGKPYCQKRRVCPEHLKADAVQCKGAGAQLWRFCQQCGRMEPLQCFEGANRSCKQGLARRRAKSASKQQAVGQRSATSCSCAQLAQAAAQHALPHHHHHQQQQQQQMSQMWPWQLQAGYAPTEAVTQCAVQAPQSSQGNGSAASLSGEMGLSLNVEGCVGACDSLDGLTDAELEAMIEHELCAAAGLQTGAAAVGGGYISFFAAHAAAVPPMAARAAAAAAAAAASVPARAAATAAQIAKLQSLMAEYADLSAALQQLQQLQELQHATGVLHRADSGSATASFFC